MDPSLARYASFTHKDMPVEEKQVGRDRGER